VILSLNSQQLSCLKDDIKKKGEVEEKVPRLKER